MPAKASEEIKVRTVRQAQKNGDVYVIERRTHYDPAKKYNVVLSSKIVGKIPKGQDNIVPTRPKRRSNGKTSNSPVTAYPVSATRKKVGMMDIIEHVGSTSGIDAALYGCTDKGTAQKIISIARYLLASNGQSLPGIATWQYTHPLPYEEGLSEDVYHALFEQVGRNELLMQSFLPQGWPHWGQHPCWLTTRQRYPHTPAGLPEPVTGSIRRGTGLRRSSCYPCTPSRQDSRSPLRSSRGTSRMWSP